MSERRDHGTSGSVRGWRLLRWSASLAAIYGIVVVGILSVGYARARQYLVGTNEAILPGGNNLTGKVTSHDGRLEIVYHTSLDVDDKAVTEMETGSVWRSVKDTVGGSKIERVTISAISSTISVAWQGWYPTAYLRERTVVYDLATEGDGVPTASVVTYWHFPRPSWMKRLEHQ